MRPIKILTVCGSGTVSSSMVASKLKEQLKERGYDVVTNEVNPGGVESALMSDKYDLIAYTSPIHGNINVPAINAVGFLTGFAEDEFMDEVMEVIKKIK
jgi:galactitol PTS system EIIB component